MEYGYIRVFGSFDDSEKELGAQFASLCKYGLETSRIVVERSTERPYRTPDLERTVENLEPGDVLVVSGFASIGYAVHDLLRIVRLCMDKGIALVSIEDSLDTRLCGEIVLSVLESVHGMERARMRRNNARRSSPERGEGKRGRPRLDDAAVENAARIFLTRKYTMREVVEKTGISQATIFKKAREIKEMAEEEKTLGLHYDPSVMQPDDSTQQ